MRALKDNITASYENGNVSRELKAKAGCTVRVAKEWPVDLSAQFTKYLLHWIGMNLRTIAWKHDNQAQIST